VTEKTLAERLRGSGYVTAFLGKWHLGGERPGHRERAFDLFYSGQATTRPGAFEGGKGEYDLTRAAQSFIEAVGELPFFLYLSHYNPHVPFQAHPDVVAANAGAFAPVYAAMIQTLDDSVGRLLSFLDAAGLRERTLVVFPSDNGGLHVPEENRPRQVTHNTPFRAGKGFLYEGGVRVPLLVQGPDIPRGCVTDAQFVNTDWTPTLLALTDQLPADNLDGIDQTGLLRTARSPCPDRQLFWHMPHYTNQGSRPSGAVRDGRWKLVEHYGAERAELFDLDEDPGETADVSPAQPDRVASLRTSLLNWRRCMGAQENRPNPAHDPRLHRKLYLDFDASRFDPLRPDDQAWKAAAAWRKQMNAVLR
jgi:arylsulfatase A